MIVVDGLVDVGQCLRLHALRGVHHQQRPFHGGERAVHLIGEVHVAGRVDEVERVGLPIQRRIGEAHGLRLDGDAALALDVHIVEHLIRHLARGQSAGDLDQPVGERGLAMVDMGDDGEVADKGLGACGHARRIALARMGHKASQPCAGPEGLQTPVWAGLSPVPASAGKVREPFRHPRVRLPPQQSGQRLGGHGVGVIIALRELASPLPQEAGLRAGLHPFRDHVEPEIAAQLDDGADDGGIIGIVLQIETKLRSIFTASMGNCLRWVRAA